MFKVEYIRLQPEVWPYKSVKTGEPMEHIRHAKGTKVNDFWYRTRMYQSEKALNQHCPKWKERGPLEYREDLGITVERITSRFNGEEWERIN